MRGRNAPFCHDSLYGILFVVSLVSNKLSPKTKEEKEMNLHNFTIKSQEAVQKAVELVRMQNR